MQASLKHVYEAKQVNQLTPESKLEFFSNTIKSYGKTALLLSGGIFFGVYHLGVIKALHDQDLLPRIICGASVGALVAATVCTRRIEDIDSIVKEGNIGFENLRPINNLYKNYFKEKAYFDKEIFQRYLLQTFQDLTFVEVYKQFGWVLNISVSIESQRKGQLLLNYLTAPTVLIRSAVQASCALPGFFNSVQLECKRQDGSIIHFLPTSSQRYNDGCLTQDLPTSQMSELFRVNSFIISQVNPMIVPFINSRGGGFFNSGMKILRIGKSLVGNEITHLINQLFTLGVLPAQFERLTNMIPQDQRV